VRTQELYKGLASASVVDWTKKSHLPQEEDEDTVPEYSHLFLNLKECNIIQGSAGAKEEIAYRKAVPIETGTHGID
jgi:hypothetical protein